MNLSLNINSLSKNYYVSEDDKMIEDDIAEGLIHNMFEENCYFDWIVDKYLFNTLFIISVICGSVFLCSFPKLQNLLYKNVQ